MTSGFEAASFWALIITSALAAIVLGWAWAVYAKNRWVWGALLGSPILICSIVLPLVIVTMFPEKCGYIDFMGSKYVVDPCTTTALVVHHLKYFSIMLLVLCLTHFFHVHLPYWAVAACVYFLTKKILMRMGERAVRT